MVDAHLVHRRQERHAELPVLGHVVGEVDLGARPEWVDEVGDERRRVRERHHLRVEQLGGVEQRAHVLERHRRTPHGCERASASERAATERACVAGAHHVHHASTRRIGRASMNTPRPTFAGGVVHGDQLDADRAERRRGRAVRHRGHRVVDRHDAHAGLDARRAAVDAAAIGGRQVARDRDRQRERLASRRIDVGEAAAHDAVDRHDRVAAPRHHRRGGRQRQRRRVERDVDPEHHALGSGRRVGQTIARPSQCSTARSSAGSSPATGSGSRSPSARANERTVKPGSPSTANAEPRGERRTGDGVGDRRHVADQLGAGGGSSRGARRRSGGRRSGRPPRTAPAAPGGSPVPCSGRSPRSRHGRIRARGRRCRPRCGRRCDPPSGRRRARRPAPRRGWRARSRRRPPRPPAWSPARRARPAALAQPFGRTTTPPMLIR